MGICLSQPHDEHVIPVKLFISKLKSLEISMPVPISRICQHLFGFIVYHVSLDKTIKSLVACADTHQQRKKLNVFYDNAVRSLVPEDIDIRALLETKYQDMIDRFHFRFCVDDVKKVGTQPSHFLKLKWQYLVDVARTFEGFNQSLATWKGRPNSTNHELLNIMDDYAGRLSTFTEKLNEVRDVNPKGDNTETRIDAYWKFASSTIEKALTEFSENHKEWRVLIEQDEIRLDRSSPDSTFNCKDSLMTKPICMTGMYECGMFGLKSTSVEKKYEDVLENLKKYELDTTIQSAAACATAIYRYLNRDIPLKRASDISTDAKAPAELSLELSSLLSPLFNKDRRFFQAQYMRLMQCAEFLSGYNKSLTSWLMNSKSTPVELLERMELGVNKVANLLTKVIDSYDSRCYWNKDMTARSPHMNAMLEQFVAAIGRVYETLYRKRVTLKVRLGDKVKATDVIEALDLSQIVTSRDHFHLLS